MGTTSLYHPVSLTLIRLALRKKHIIAGHIHQSESSPLGAWAEYDITISTIQAGQFKNNLLTPAFVKEQLEACFRTTETTVNAWLWYGHVIYVNWSKDHWIAHVCISLSPEVA